MSNNFIPVCWITSSNMELIVATVNKKRSYHSPRRHRQAILTRKDIMDAARRRFLADGFAGTTISSIAEDADVSVDTVYKNYGGKAGLVRAIFEAALAGEGQVHAEIRSDQLQMTEVDPKAIMRGFGRLVAEVAPRAAPILLLIQEAASTDPEMVTVAEELDGARMKRMAHNASNLAAAGHLRPGISIEKAGQICWVYTSPQLYQMLVVKLGWPAEDFGEFVAEALIAALLPTE
ncbi:MAG: TetR/AcrR family transcriptional regulator [Acidimicrobiia bacterium]